MNRSTLLVSLLILLSATTIVPAMAQAQANRAATERQIVANERAVNDAIAKHDMTAFRANVAPDALSVDVLGISRINSPDFDRMIAALTIQSWDLDGSQFYWVNDATVVHVYRWTGRGTYQGQPIASPTWASTVWTNRGGKWLAVFHQETMAMPGPPLGSGPAAPATTTR